MAGAAFFVCTATPLAAEAVVLVVEVARLVALLLIAAELAAELATTLALWPGERF